MSICCGHVSVQPRLSLRFHHIFIFPKVRLCIQTSHALFVSFRSVTPLPLDFSSFPPLRHRTFPPFAPLLRKKIPPAGVPNGGKINDFFFRGAHSSKQGLAHHEQQDATAIVKLPGWGAKSRPSASKPILLVSATSTFRSVAGRRRPTNSSLNSLLACVARPARRFLSIVNKVKTAPAS